MERSVACEIRQNAFPGIRPDPTGGAHDAPQTSCFAGRGLPFPHPIPLGAVNSPVFGARHSSGCSGEGITPKYFYLEPTLIDAIVLKYLVLLKSIVHDVAACTGTRSYHR